MRSLVVEKDGYFNLILVDFRLYMQFDIECIEYLSAKKKFTWNLSGISTGFPISIMKLSKYTLNSLSIFALHHDVPSTSKRMRNKHFALGISVTRITFTRVVVERIYRFSRANLSPLHVSIFREMKNSASSRWGRWISTRW